MPTAMKSPPVMAPLKRRGEAAGRQAVPRGSRPRAFRLQGQPRYQWLARRSPQALDGQGKSLHAVRFLLEEVKPTLVSPPRISP